MSWTRDWVNVFHNEVGHGPESQLTIAREVDFSGKGQVRIEETSITGSVILQFYKEKVSPAEPINEPVEAPDVLGFASYGNPKVYLAIGWPDGSRRFLSAPLQTRIELKGVRRMALVIFAPLPPQIDQANYTYDAGLNAHCVFSVKDGTRYEISRFKITDPNSAWW
ncbi:MAG: hypothetical protein R3301_09150 [Saprospiraceae bacterium]|nr:hypothetical protein [Saprospiraceae bacterium]